MQLHAAALTLWLMYICASVEAGSSSGDEAGPRFVSRPGNITVAEGRSARLVCAVDALGNFKMAWIHKGATRRAVLATGSQVVTKNPRISATREGQTFVLNIDGVTEKDEGDYLCQLNTKPTLTHTLGLNVVVPPVIVDVGSSRDVTADEGQDVTLTCDARGRPQPSIRWVREDSAKISSAGKTADEWVGRELRLGPLQRSSAGAFLCIASNGVPPIVSKRVLLNVNFAPVLEPPSSVRVGAVLGGDARFSCSFSAHPAARLTWRDAADRVVAESQRVAVVNEELQPLRWRSSLLLRAVTSADFGGFKCEARNARGSDALSFTLFEMTTTTPPTTITTTAGWTSPPPSSPLPAITTTWWPTSSPPPFIPWWGPSTLDPSAPAPGAGAAPSPRKHTGQYFQGGSVSAGPRPRPPQWFLLINLLVMKTIMFLGNQFMNGQA